MKCPKCDEKLTMTRHSSVGPHHYRCDSCYWQGSSDKIHSMQGDKRIIKLEEENKDQLENIQDLNLGHSRMFDEIESLVSLLRRNDELLERIRVEELTDLIETVEDYEQVRDDNAKRFEIYPEKKNRDAKVLQKLRENAGPEGYGGRR